MKKLFYSLLVLAMAATTFTSCEDVPAPYNDPNNNGGGTTTEITPAGSGTEADPYNVAAALQKIKALAANVNSEPIYVKGKIVSIKSVETQTYGNATYYISDDGTAKNQLYIYQGYYLGNKKFTAEDQIKVGDEVVIYGPFVNYNGNTPETVGKGQTYIYSLNGKKDENGKLTGVKIAKVESFKDENGRLGFKEIEGSEEIIKVDFVFLAIGFLHPYFEGLIENSKVQIDGRGNVSANVIDHHTSQEKYFAAGDVRRGQSLVVWAISEGRNAAKAIHEHLRKNK